MITNIYFFLLRILQLLILHLALMLSKLGLHLCLHWAQYLMFVHDELQMKSLKQHSLNLTIWRQSSYGLPSMKVKKLEKFWNKMVLKGCKWSSLNAPRSETHVPHPQSRLCHHTITDQHRPAIRILIY